MEKLRFIDNQIIAALKRVETGLAVPEMCGELGVCSATFYKSRAKVGGMYTSMMLRMKELEDEAELIHRTAPWKTRTHWNWPRLNGCHGLTITDCWSPSVTFHLPKLKKITTCNWPVRPPCWSDLTQRASTKLNAIQSENSHEKKSSAG